MSDNTIKTVIRQAWYEGVTTENPNDDKAVGERLLTYSGILNTYVRGILDRIEKANEEMPPLYFNHHTRDVVHQIRKELTPPVNTP